MTHGPNTGVNLIKLLQVYFTCVIIVLGSKNNGYTCKSFIELTPELCIQTQATKPTK